MYQKYIELTSVCFLDLSMANALFVHISSLFDKHPKCLKFPMCNLRSTLTYCSKLKNKEIVRNRL